MLTTADRPTTRLLKTKMFTEQLIVSRKANGPPGTWNAPVVQSKPLDTQINDWVDHTGNEIVSTTAPGMFMQWMDADRTTRLVICSVMVTFVPAVALPIPVVAPPPPPAPPSPAPHNDKIPGWEPVITE